MQNKVSKINKRQKRLSGWHKYAVIALPYLWMALFFFVPFLIILKISFAESLDDSVPPYTSLFSYDAEEFKLNFSAYLGNYVSIFEDSTYLYSYLKSIKIALISTLLCLLIGYPMAWAIATSKSSVRNALLMLVIMPSWTSFLIRIYAWMGILKPEGYLNSFLQWLNVIDEPLQLLHTDIAVYIGIVYAYLPFMILPLYTAIVRVDYTLIEAGYDLGCRPTKCFFSLFVPQTYSGIIAGSMLVFIPAVGEYIIPELLGGPGANLIGRTIWAEYFMTRDWPLAAALATIMLLILVIPIVLFYKTQRKEITQGAR